MAPPSSTMIKSLASQFHDLTGASEYTAKRLLKASGYKLDVALDQFYQAGDSASSKTAPVKGKLESLFETLRDANNDERDKMELESTMGYLGEKLGVNLENAELFVALEVIQAPVIGEITKAGFVQGWLATRTGSTIPTQATYLKTLIPTLSSDTALFKKVYKHAFVAGRERDQKALSLENAVIYWTMLFSAPGWRWVSKNYDWLALWKRFLDEKWTRSVNKDMWNMVLEFALKSVGDEALSFWSEDGAWPSVIDDFVAWCKANGVGEEGGMDVDGQS